MNSNSKLVKKALPIKDSKIFQMKVNVNDYNV